MKQYLYPPRFVDQEKDRIGEIQYAVTFAALFGLLMLMGYRVALGQFGILAPLFVASFVLLVAIVLIRKGFLEWSGVVISWTLLALVDYLLYTGDGIHDIGIVALPAVLVIAALVLARRYFYLFTVISLSSVVAIGSPTIIEIFGGRPGLGADMNGTIDLIVILGVTTVTIRLLADSLLRSLERARSVEKQLRSHTEQLGESAKRYQTLFESANDAILILESGRFIDCNAKAVSMFGCQRREEILNASPWDFSPKHQPDGSISEAKANEILQMAYSGTPQSFHWKHVRRDGTLFDAEVSLNCLEYGQEKLVQALVRDVTDRKQMEEALRKYKRAVEHSPVSIVITDTAGTIEYVNPKFTELTGYSPDEAVGQNPSILKSGQVSAEVYKELWDTVTSGGVWQGELCNRKKDGGLYWEKASIAPVTDETGSITHFLALKEDITRQRDDERTLQESEELYRKLITTVPDFIVRTDLEGYILFVNETAFPASLPVAKERFLGRSLISFIAEEDKARATENSRRMLEGPLGPREYTLSFGDGERMQCEVNGDILRSFDGTPYGKVFVIRDVSERKREEERRNKLEVQLFQAQKLESIGTLAAGIAHDFNNVLSLIMGNIGLIVNSRIKDEKLAKRIDAIERATDRGAQVVKQLLTYARKTTIVRRSVEINDLIREVTGLLEASLPKTIEVRLQCAGDPPSIHGDLNQLHQVLLNLGVNARDAMPNGGLLTITTRSVEGDLVRTLFPKASAKKYVRLSVIDTGTGMAEETRKRLFDPFFTTKEMGKGTGLGLAVVHGIVENHNGFIEVESQLGKGSEFAIYLPAAVQVTDVLEHAPLQFNSAPGGTETILLVEDELLAREFVSEVLTLKGYRVISAGDGAEGVEMFESNASSISMMIADVDLPKLNGEELCRQVKRAQPALPLIVVSGYINPEKQSALVNIGVEDILEKPYKLEDLLFRIRSILDKRKAAA